MDGRSLSSIPLAVKLMEPKENHAIDPRSSRAKRLRRSARAYAGNQHDAPAGTQPGTKPARPCLSVFRRFAGGVEVVARTLAKAVNCASARTAAKRSASFMRPVRFLPADRARFHPDVLWVRPESKSRVITMDQMRDLMRAVHLKPTAAEFKVERRGGRRPAESPGGQRILEDPRRAARQFHPRSSDHRAAANFGNCPLALPPTEFRRRRGADSRPTRGLAGRLQRTGRPVRAGFDVPLPVARPDLEETWRAGERHRKIARRRARPWSNTTTWNRRLREKLEGELEAAVESEYRRQRADVLGALHWWLRDVWLQTLKAGGLTVCFPELKAAAAAVAARISPAEAMRNLEHIDRLQRQLQLQRAGGPRLGSGPAEAEIVRAILASEASKPTTARNSTAQPLLFMVLAGVFFFITVVKLGVPVVLDFAVSPPEDWRDAIFGRQ